MTKSSGDGTCRICGDSCDTGSRFSNLCKRCGSKREEYAKVLVSAVALGELRSGPIADGPKTWIERVRHRLDDVFTLADDAVRSDVGVARGGGGR